MKTSIYKWFVFSHTPTFGWYVTILTLIFSKEYKYHKESRYTSLFSFSYSTRAMGVTKEGMFWKGTTYTLHLFFKRMFEIRRIKSIEPIEDERDLY